MSLDLSLYFAVLIESFHFSLGRFGPNHFVKISGHTFIRSHCFASDSTLAYESEKKIKLITLTLKRPFFDNFRIYYLRSQRIHSIIIIIYYL